MNNKKLVALICSVLLLIGAAGATLAWLTDQTTPVTNTFTASDVDIEFVETTGSEYKMVPGSDIDKNPTVTVEPGSEDCWVFVKVTESGKVVVGDEEYGFDDFLTYEVDEPWALVDGYNDADPVKVYYIKQDAIATTATKVPYNVLVDNQVKVESSVTKAMMDALDNNTAKDDYPKLTFEAFAIQQANLDYGEVTDEAKMALIAWNTLFQ